MKNITILSTTMSGNEVVVQTNANNFGQLLVELKERDLATNYTLAVDGSTKGPDGRLLKNILNENSNVYDGMVIFIRPKDTKNAISDFQRLRQELLEIPDYQDLARTKFGKSWTQLGTIELEELINSTKSIKTKKETKEPVAKLEKKATEDSNSNKNPEYIWVNKNEKVETNKLILAWLQYGDLNGSDKARAFFSTI